MRFLGEFNPNFNALDGNVNRESHTGEYQVENGYPLNPIGRTGLKGRGLLGRWGVNHAADPVVSRWKRCADGEIFISSQNYKYDSQKLLKYGN